MNTGHRLLCREQVFLSPCVYTFRRPPEEVSVIMDIFFSHQNGTQRRKQQVLLTQRRGELRSFSCLYRDKSIVSGERGSAIRPPSANFSFCCFCFRHCMQTARVRRSVLKKDPLNCYTRAKKVSVLTPSPRRFLLFVLHCEISYQTWNTNAGTPLSINQSGDASRVRSFLHHNHADAFMMRLFSLLGVVSIYV